MLDQKIVNRLNALAVSSYKLVGFGILAFILFGLVSYLGVQGFFFLSRSWVAPTVVSPADERVLSISATVAEHELSRGALLAERRELEARIAHEGRVASAEAKFRERFRRALSGEKAARWRELGRLRKVQAQLERERDGILASNRAFAALARDRADVLHGASLLEREAYLGTNRQLAALAQGNIDLAEREASLGLRVDTVRRELAGLAVAAAETEPPASAPSTVSVLKLERELASAGLERARAEGEVAQLQASIAAIDEAIGRYDALLASLRESALLKALDARLTVAFVPYENLEGAEPGAPLYACAAGPLLCHRVGEIRGVLEGEVQLKHPIRNRVLRGVMAEIRLEDERWVREEILHVGRPPLFI